MRKKLTVTQIRQLIKEEARYLREVHKYQFDDSVSEAALHFLERMHDYFVNLYNPFEAGVGKEAWLSQVEEVTDRLDSGLADLVKRIEKLLLDGEFYEDK